jgi:hypothetical protein
VAFPTVERPDGSAPSLDFYAEILRLVGKARIPFLVGGTYAINAYLATGRQTKDVDIFCRAGDYPRILRVCAGAGYTVEVLDERWIAKVRRGSHFCDVIFGSANAIAPVTDDWFAGETRQAKILSVHVRLLPPAELIWSKAFIEDRYKYDGNDIAHLMLRTKVDWKRLLHYMDQHWEVLLGMVLRFRYIYPSERGIIPEWLLGELLARLADQRRLPQVETRICRGRVFSRDDFEVDVLEWGFADVVGKDRAKGEKKP